MIRRNSLWALSLVAIVAVTTLSAGDAEARRKKRRQANKAQVTSQAHIKALQELMGAFKFGMKRDQVITVMKKQITERYAEQVSNTSDVYKQDDLRRKRDKEIERIRESYVEFEGKRTGWDVSIIEDQFAHRTEESMLVYWENFQGRNQRRFFFFFEGRLHKMFIALDTTALELSDDQRNFAFFRRLMENRFGPGQERDRGITWETRSFRVEALNRLAIYSSFCLVIADLKLTRQLERLREERKQAPKPRNSIIEAVTADEGDVGPGLDENATTIDDILKD